MNIPIGAMVGIAIGGIITLIGIIVNAYRSGIKYTQLDAIKNGVGEYYLDENNERQFRWKK